MDNFTPHKNDILISVIIPCRNEVKHIQKCILSILSQENMDGIFEILVIDGMSDDGTREVLSEISQKNVNVKILDNPTRFTPNALNIGIKNSVGKYICIMGAHSEYDKNFLANSIELMREHPEVSCVGGPIISLGKNRFAEAVAIAMSSRIGVGNAKHRFPDYEGYAEMACFPVFRRDVFDLLGMYDEMLLKNQDDEFCFRLNKSGRKVFISPKVKSYYFVRETPIKLFNQYFDYGFWRVAVIKKHKIPIAFRQLVPILFYLSVFLIFIFSVIINNLILGLIIPIFYVTFIILYGLISAIRFRRIHLMIHIPITILLLHFSYAAGFLKGLIMFRKV